MWPPLNYDRCRARLRALRVGSTKVLTNSAFSRATIGYFRAPDVGETEWRERLPKPPFDFAWFVEVMEGYFNRTSWLASVLSGEELSPRSTDDPRLAGVVAGLSNPIAQRLLVGAVEWARSRSEEFDPRFYAHVLATLFRLVSAGSAEPVGPAQLAMRTGGWLFGETLQRLRAMPPSQRARAFAERCREISGSTGGAWSATRFLSADGGELFVGEGAGQALVFDPLGNMYAGNLVHHAALPLSDESARPFLPDYRRLRGS